MPPGQTLKDSTVSACPTDRELRSSESTRNPMWGGGGGAGLFPAVPRKCWCRPPFPPWCSRKHLVRAGAHLRPEEEGQGQSPPEVFMSREGGGLGAPLSLPRGGQAGNPSGRGRADRVIWRCKRQTLKRLGGLEMRRCVVLQSPYCLGKNRSVIRSPADRQTKLHMCRGDGVQRPARGQHVRPKEATSNSTWTPDLGTRSWVLTPGVGGGPQ